MHVDEDVEGCCPSVARQEEQEQLRIMTTQNIVNGSFIVSRERLEQRSVANLQEEKSLHSLSRDSPRADRRQPQLKYCTSIYLQILLRFI